jgi:hypothetical protein
VASFKAPHPSCDCSGAAAIPCCHQSRQPATLPIALKWGNRATPRKWEVRLGRMGGKRRTTDATRWSVEVAICRWTLRKGPVPSQTGAGSLFSSLCLTGKPGAPVGEERFLRAEVRDVVGAADLERNDVVDPVSSRNPSELVRTRFSTRCSAESGTWRTSPVWNVDDQGTVCPTPTFPLDGSVSPLAFVTRASGGL